MHKLHYNVSGLINSESKTQVKNALEKIKGVQKIGVDLHEGVIEIGYNDPANERQIADCIENTGFEIE